MTETPARDADTRVDHLHYPIPTDFERYLGDRRKVNRSYHCNISIHLLVIKMKAIGQV